MVSPFFLLSCPFFHGEIHLFSKKSNVMPFSWLAIYRLHYSRRTSDGHTVVGSEPNRERASGNDQRSRCGREWHDRIRRVLEFDGQQNEGNQTAASLSFRFALLFFMLSSNDVAWFVTRKRMQRRNWKRLSKCSTRTRMDTYQRARYVAIDSSSPYSAYAINRRVTNIILWLSDVRATRLVCDSKQRLVTDARKMWGVSC